MYRDCRKNLITYIKLEGNTGPDLCNVCVTPQSVSVMKVYLPGTLAVRKLTFYDDGIQALFARPKLILSPCRFRIFLATFVNVSTAVISSLLALRSKDVLHLPSNSSTNLRETLFSCFGWSCSNPKQPLIEMLEDRRDIRTIIKCLFLSSL